MTFDQEVRDYLEEVERKPPVLEPARHRRIDESALRKTFLARLRELEQQESFGQIEDLFQGWSSKLGRFVRYLEMLPPNDAPTDDAEAFAFACRALDQAIDYQDASVGFVDRLELARIVDGFDKPRLVETYAFENRLVRRDSSQKAEVTDLGHAFLRLRGEDAVRWLLTIEVAQSRGAWDPWRASRELLQEVLSDDGITQVFGSEAFSGFPFDMATLQRLVRFDLVYALVNDLDEIYCYRINPLMREVVQRVLDGGPWHAAVAALLEDERDIVLPIREHRARDATVAQTRLIAHEVRNALVPVRHHLDAMLRAKHEVQRDRLEASRRGVVRVLAFVDEMIATSELVNEPPTLVEVGDVIRDALGWIDGGERVELELPPGAIRIRAHRSRLQRALSNMALNALQATSVGQRVRVRARSSGGMAEIVFDDGGPGVPEESRAIIFQDGFTTRGGRGGSGFGLSYVSKVVGELHGTVSCETSDLGGARFVIAIPEGEADK